MARRLRSRRNLNQPRFAPTKNAIQASEINVFSDARTPDLYKGRPMSQTEKMFSFENPWKEGDNDSRERTLVRGGPERPSFTRTPENRTHHIKPSDAALLLDELFPVGVERIEVRYVYAETSYQKQFLRGRWALLDNESEVPMAYFEREEEAESVVRLLNGTARTNDVDSSASSVRTIGFYPPLRSVIGGS
jgi:hypothetical protein